MKKLLLIGLIGVVSAFGFGNYNPIENLNVASIDYHIGRTDGDTSSGLYVGLDKYLKNTKDLSMLDINYFSGIKKINKNNATDPIYLEWGIKPSYIFPATSDGSILAEGGLTGKLIVRINGNQNRSGLGIGPFVRINFMPNKIPLSFNIGLGYNFIIAKNSYNENYLTLGLKINF